MDGMIKTLFGRLLLLSVCSLGVMILMALDTKLNGWPLIQKVWLGIVCVGFLVAAYRVDKGTEYGYWGWRQRQRLAPVALLAFLIYAVGMLVLHALHLVTFGGG